MDNDINPSPLYDIIILGASGFTGKYVLREALKFLNSPSSPLKSLAIAGRNHSKLTQALKWAANNPNANSPPPSIPILTADTTDPSSLRLICSQTRLILNCVGPFRLHGNPVVAACVQAGCDYLDICGEPEFMERMEYSYHDQAVENGALVVSACGFDSVPAELGWMFNSNQWVYPAVPNQIEAYLSLESDRDIVANFGTFQSAVLGVANMDKLQELRKSKPRRTKPKIPGPYPQKGSTIDYHKEFGLWLIKLPSADTAVVSRTLATLAKHPHGLPGANESDGRTEKRKKFWSATKPAYFGLKLGSNCLLGLFQFITLGVSIGYLGRSCVGRWLLLNFPSIFSLGWFSKKGPSEEEVASASFKMWFVGRGYRDLSRRTSAEAGDKIQEPDAEIITRVTGPDAGYSATPIILLQCALIVLGQRDGLPNGGVLTPGIVFGPTNLRERLQQNGISFDVISSKKNCPY